MKNLLNRLAARLPDTLWEVISAETCLLPYYHMVSDVPVPHVSPLYHFRSVAEFSADLDYLLGIARPLTLDEFIASVRTVGTPPKKSFLLTFDDGFREMHDIVLPILAAKGVPAVFFLTSATIDNAALGHHQKISVLLHRRETEGGRFPENEICRLLAAAGVTGTDAAEALKATPWRLRSVIDDAAHACGLDFNEYVRAQKPYLTSDQAHDLLKKGMALGAHSINHPLYADISLDEQLRQTRESMETLARLFPLKHRAFAFPHSDRGVSTRFFDTVLGERTIDVSFGTSGPALDSIKLNFQRFTMEKTLLPADAILARNRIRRIKLKLMDATSIQRT